MWTWSDRSAREADGGAQYPGAVPELPNVPDLLRTAVHALGGMTAMLSRLHAMGAAAGTGAGDVTSFFPDFSRGLTAQALWSLPAITFLVFLGVQWWAFWYPGAEPGGGGYIANSGALAALTLTQGVFSGTIDGAISVQKGNLAAGILTLSGNNTFTGDILLQPYSGRLILDGTNTSRTATVTVRDVMGRTVPSYS